MWNFQPQISGTGNVRLRTGTNADGSANGGPRVRIQSTANNWVGDPYLAWLATFPALTGADRAPDVDFDGDGLVNGLEFVLGSNPASSASAGLVGSVFSGGNLVLTFKSSEASKAYAVVVEHGTTLAT